MDQLICGSCGKKFPLEEIKTFIQHKLIGCVVVDKEKLLCNSCNKVLEDPWKLVQHVQTVHKMNIYSVPSKMQSARKSMETPSTCLTMRGISEVVATEVREVLQEYTSQLKGTVSKSSSVLDGSKEFEGSEEFENIFDSNITVNQFSPEWFVSLPHEAQKDMVDASTQSSLKGVGNNEGCGCSNPCCGINVLPGTHEPAQSCCFSIVPKKRKRHMETKHCSLTTCCTTVTSSCCTSIRKKVRLSASKSKLQICCKQTSQRRSIQRKDSFQQAERQTMQNEQELLSTYSCKTSSKSKKVLQSTLQKTAERNSGKTGDVADISQRTVTNYNINVNNVPSKSLGKKILLGRNGSLNSFEEEPNADKTNVAVSDSERGMNGKFLLPEVMDISVATDTNDEVDNFLDRILDSNTNAEHPKSAEVDNAGLWTNNVFKEGFLGSTNSEQTHYSEASQSWQTEDNVQELYKRNAPAMKDTYQNSGKNFSSILSEMDQNMPLTLSSFLPHEDLGSDPTPASKMHMTDTDSNQTPVLVTGLLSIHNNNDIDTPAPVNPEIEALQSNQMLDSSNHGNKISLSAEGSSLQSIDQSVPLLAATDQPVQMMTINEEQYLGNSQNKIGEKTNKLVIREKNNEQQKRKRVYPTSRPFECSQCDKKFNQKVHLIKHSSKHSGVKPFKCELCNYSTVEKSHLKVHMRIHTGEKPYKCHECDYSTAQKSTLTVHVRRHHVVKSKLGHKIPDYIHQGIT